MTKEKKEELLKALNLINKVCLMIEKCCDCPLRDKESNGCYLMTEIPNHWNVMYLKIDDKDDWRAFYD